MFYSLMWLLLKPIFTLAFRLSTRGTENIPSEGPAVIVANHASYLDPLVVGLAQKRKIAFMAKSELFDVPVLRWIIVRLNSFPIKRGVPDRRALKTALDHLSQGDMIGIFPQGTRDNEIGEAFPGAAMIAYKSGAQIIPTAIVGTDRVMPKGARLPRFAKITVIFGAPIKIEEGLEKKDAIAKATSMILREIKGLVDERSRGHKLNASLRI